MDNKKFDSINWKQEFPPVPECVHASVLKAGKEVSQKKMKSGKHISKKGIVLLAATMTLVFGSTAFAANGIWQQRMESMNEAEMTEYFLSITESNAPAFRYSRNMTETEKIHYEQLEAAYELDGVFPQGMLTMLSEGEEYAGNGVGYSVVSGTFLLPNTELTEEQLLQIIDFYHRADYSLQQISELVQNGEVEMPKDILDEKPIDMLQYEAINEQVSYLKLTLENTELPKEIAAGEDYLYLGYKDVVQRMPVGTTEVTELYRFAKNEQLYAMDADTNNNLFLSILETDEGKDSINNKLVKIDSTGCVIAEYDVAGAVSDSGKKLSNLMAYKMQESLDGKLYVKTFWSGELLLFVFNSKGDFIGTVSDKDVETHPAGGMCVGTDGNLYILGKQEMVCIDPSNSTIEEKGEYATNEMIAAVDLLYQMDEETFYMFSYDGVFYTDGMYKECDRILAPQESDVFKEGARVCPVNHNVLAVVNYEDWGVSITYLKVGQK